MPFRSRRFTFWILSVLLFACAGSVQAGERGRIEEADSLLKSYYKTCKARVNDPEVLAMCDTLYMRGEKAGIPGIQAVALCLRLDHYYYRNDREQIIGNVQRVKDFCVQTDKEGLRYFYYFAWSSRLITYYIKQSQFNVAIYETRKMLSEAEAEDYPHGVADCYRMLANLYLSQNTFQRAYENFRRGVEVFERNGIDDVNLPTHYASMAQCALELNMPDSAAVALRKAEACPRMSNYQRFTVNKAQALYYIYIRDYAEAGRYVAEADALFRDDPSMRVYMQGLRYLKKEYYKATGQYEKALDAILSSRNDSVQEKVSARNFALSRDLGDVYFLMNDMRRSAESYRDYIRVSDSVRNGEVRSSTDDFSGILEISRLQGETRELQLAMQHKRLRNTYLIVFSLVVVLALGGVVFLRVWKLNRRLKRSEAVVLAQNEHLRVAGEELREAKERAELASRMKTDFIQNMSHEVRTPLNSIVGFSQVLASQFRNNPSTGEYAEIIESSSRNLLRLVDDVLDIAFLDRADQLPRTDYCEMNGCCRECVSKALPEVRPRVALIFEPSDVNPVVHTNPKRVQQVLLHLLHNAAKFTEQGEITLTYTCLVEQRLMRFLVTDTGPGIPAGKQEAVFGRFVKLNAFSQGTGLGLPVCRVIAAKLGGSLTVDMNYRRGCRMIFEVPFAMDKNS